MAANNSARHSLQNSSGDATHARGRIADSNASDADHSDTEDNHTHDDHGDTDDNHTHGDPEDGDHEDLSRSLVHRKLEALLAEL